MTNMLSSDKHFCGCSSSERLLTKRLLLKVYPHGACYSIGNDQWRGGQVVCSGVGVNSPFKVSVP